MRRIAATAVLSCLTVVCLIRFTDGMKKAKVVKWVEMMPHEPACHCKPKIIIEKVPYPVIEKIKIPVHHHHVVIKKKEKKKKPKKKPKPKKKKKDMKYKKMYKEYKKLMKEAMKEMKKNMKEMEKKEKEKEQEKEMPVMKMHEEMPMPMEYPSWMRR